MNPGHRLGLQQIMKTRQGSEEIGLNGSGKEMDNREEVGNRTPRTIQCIYI